MGILSSYRSDYVVFWHKSAQFVRYTSTFQQNLHLSSSERTNKVLVSSEM